MLARARTPVPSQIICVVREQGTESLPPPPNDELPAGPLVGPGVYNAYVQLMRDCRCGWGAAAGPVL